MALDAELAEIRDFLAQHAPFDSLPSGVLAGLPRRLTVEYHRRGRSIIARGKDNHSLYVLRSGAVDIRDDQGMPVDRAEAGDVFKVDHPGARQPLDLRGCRDRGHAVYVLPG